MGNLLPINQVRMTMRLWAKLLICSAVVSMSACSGAQEDKSGLSHTTKKAAAPMVNGPVTLGEVYATIDRLEQGVRRVVLASTQAPNERSASPDRPATRAEILGEFWRLFQLAKPYFKFTPRPVNFEAKNLSTPASDPLRKPLETLIRYGFVGKVSPIATNTASDMSLEDYADALGFFMSRLGDITHTPSSKWSPYMFNHRDG